ncbi:MAG TPA: hypothetical protein VJR47_00535 [Stellaceae bacterium]|nr:hypothetical protein [Stellaceae bacterium]
MALRIVARLLQVFRALGDRAELGAKLVVVRGEGAKLVARLLIMGVGIGKILIGGRKIVLYLRDLGAKLIEARRILRTSRAGRLTRRLVLLAQHLMQVRKAGGEINGAAEGTQKNHKHHRLQPAGHREMPDAAGALNEKLSFGKKSFPEGPQDACH